MPEDLRQENAALGIQPTCDLARCASQEMGTAREIVNRVQKMRKKAGLQASDPVAIFIDVPPTNGETGLQHP